MALTGQAKTDYQREYMRKRRSNIKAAFVRPKPLDPIGSYTGELTKARQVGSKGFNEIGG